MSTSVDQPEVTSTSCAFAPANVPGDPVKVMGSETSSGNDVKLIFGDATYSEIALDSAAGVEHLGIHNGAHWFVNVVGANPIQRRQRIGSLKHKLRKDVWSNTTAAFRGRDALGQRH